MEAEGVIKKCVETPQNCNEIEKFAAERWLQNNPRTEKESLPRKLPSRYTLHGLVNPNNSGGKKSKKSKKFKKSKKSKKQRKTRKKCKK